MAVSIKKEDIGRLKSKILRPSLTSHYICDFTPPNTNFFRDRNVNISQFIRYDRLSLACSEASLPGSSLATIDINNDFHGVSEKHAYRRLYDDRADFTFFVDSEEYYVIRFFEAWISYCINEQYNNDRIKGEDNYTYRVNFPKDYYAPNMSIAKFERDYGLTSERSSLEYRFVGAFPISISSMPVSYDASSLMKCTVSFSYQRYYLSPFVGSSPTTVGNPNATAISELRGKVTKTGGNTPLTPSIEQSIQNDPRAQQFNSRNLFNNKAVVRVSNFNELA